MKVGSLVHGRHDPAYAGIVVEIGPEETFTDHERRACRVNGSMATRQLNLLKCWR